MITGDWGRRCEGGVWSFVELLDEGGVGNGASS